LWKGRKGGDVRVEFGSRAGVVEHGSHVGYLPGLTSSLDLKGSFLEDLLYNQVNELRSAPAASLELRSETYLFHYTEPVVVDNSISDLCLQGCRIGLNASVRP
jgi:hypothetical protein